MDVEIVEEYSAAGRGLSLNDRRDDLLIVELDRLELSRAARPGAGDSIA